jgi:hypothetical protein
MAQCGRLDKPHKLDNLKPALILQGEPPAVKIAMYCCRVSNFRPSGAIMVRLSPPVSVGSNASISRVETAARCASTAARNAGGGETGSQAGNTVNTSKPAAK